jgi:hypothetical protein
MLATGKLNSRAGSWLHAYETSMHAAQLSSRLHWSCCVQVLLARVATKLGTAVNSSAAAAAAAVTAGAAASVSAELPVLPDAVRRDIGAAALEVPRYQRLIKSGLHAIVANSSR